MVAPREHFARPVQNVSLIRKVHRQSSANLDREYPSFGFTSPYTSNKLSTNIKRQRNFKFTLYFDLQHTTSKWVAFHYFLHCVELIEMITVRWAPTVHDSGQSKIEFDFLRYATSYLLQRQSGVGFEVLYEAGRRGRTGEDCRTLFMDCNAVWTSSPSQHSVERGLDSAGFWNLFAARI